ncbi:cyclin-T2b isoform X1 [Alosa sapidissima]|uniref:cyclin-T2b isoform X1 n=2 Tax=Alosa sapidissima TaxID=34773 RepID=UPI001C095EB2|nr:cyclin-T2b isoform X1 [Alosa sapidissima]
MAAVYRGSSKWLFTPEQLENTPSRRSGIEPDRELSYRQQAANLIQDMGQRLNVSQLTINTAIVYMHRFYMLHSFTKFHRNIISPTTLFLAAKVEEQPRKLEHVIKVSHACLYPQDPPLDTKSNAYLQQAQELVLLETIVLQTLGFEITIEHPHTDVVRCSQLVRASKDLAQTSYFMATNRSKFRELNMLCLHLTTFCLQHRPQVVACVCIHLACKWSNWEIPISSDGKHWWEYVDTSVTLELLDQLTHEFLQILEKTPSRLKRIRNWRANQAAKKTKTDTSSADSSFQGLCLAKNSSLDSLLDMRSSAFSDLSNSSTSSFQLDLPSSSAPSLSLNGMAGLPASAYPFPASSAQASDVYSLKADTLSGPLATQQPLLHQAALPPPPPPAPAPMRLSLDKYREKQAAELAMAKRREAERSDASATATTAQPEPHRKHAHHHHGSGGSGHLQALGSGGDGSVRVKYAVPGADPSSSSSSRSSSKSLKRRLPAAENGSGGGSQEELRMKIKVSERHAASSSSSSSSSGGYGGLEVPGGGIAGSGSSGGKSKHASPRQSRDKHREHSSHRQSKHGHSHSSSGVLSLGGHGDASSASSSSSGHHGHHQQSQAHHGHHHHSSKSSRSSKSSGGSSHHRSSGSTASVQQEVLCQSAGLGAAFPATGLPHQAAYGSLSTLVKADKKQSEGHGADASLALNGQHMDYEDTFNMLDSLLSAQQMNF